MLENGKSSKLNLGSVHLKRGGMQIPYWIWGGGGGGQVNSALDLGGGGSCKFRIRGKKPVMLHFLFLYNTRQEPLSGIELRGGGGVKGEVDSGSAPPVWI